MYSSPLTGLTVQYDRRICEDDDNWVSTLDSSVGCSSLSPTDERCHHYDVNGDTGYESCPTSCGNCFEDSDSPSDDSNGIGSQPIGLYEGENGETNEFDPLGSSSRGRGDLEDLVYKFTYEINDKINELSDKIDDFKDNTNSRIDDNEEANRGICYKKVCTNKTDPPTTGDTTTGETTTEETTNVDTTTGENTGSPCQGVTADICSGLTYTDCEQNTCCKLRDGSDGFPEYTRAGESRECDGNHFYSPVSRDVVDNEIINSQNKRSSPNSRTDSGNAANTSPNEPTDDFTININDDDVLFSNPVKRGNITYIPITGRNTSKITTLSLDSTNAFFQDKIVSYAMFNTHKGSSDFNITSSPSSSWTKYTFNNDIKPIGNDNDCLILKIALSDTNATNICYNDDNIPKPAYCDIFYDKDASYYIYTFGTDSNSVGESLKYGDFYYATKTDNDNLNLKKIQMNGDNTDDTVTYNNKDKNKHDIRTTKQEFIGPKIVGLYFLYNINILFLSTLKDGVNSVSIRPTPLTITIEYPLEDDNKDMGEKIVNINDIFAMNDNLMSPSPFLYKIHDFNETDNINLADIKINVDKHYFFVKNHNTKCESSLIDITWWCLFVIITLITFYNLYQMPKLSDTKNIPIIAILAIIMLCVIIIIPLLDRDWRAYIKFGLWWIVFLISIIIYAIDVKDLHLNTSILLSIVYLINITTYTDYRDKFINPDKDDCDLKYGYPMLYIFCAIVMVIVRHYYFSSQQVDKKYHLTRKIVGSVGIAIYFISSHNNTIDIISEWFGYYDTSSMRVILIFFRDFFILV